MMETSLRGARLGTTSYETDLNVILADRTFVAYDCPRAHCTVVPFSVEAEEIPTEWECRCGATALRLDAEAPQAKAAKVGRTHWDMLLERRSIDDLEELLAERLDLLATRSGPARKSA
jgi:thioesterase domain-containing protein